MKCPVCRETDLLMTDRQGVEIDYCPQCRGIWLDRGELDKIIERAAAPAPSNRERPQELRGRDDDWDDDDHSAKGSTYPKKKKRGSLLGELFDF